MRDPVLQHLSEELSRAGWNAVRFQFLYRENGRKAPDRLPKLTSTYGAVVNDCLEFLDAGEALVLTGKSMGGRAAASLALEREDVAGLAFFGYPLVPPGKPGQVGERTELLASQRADMPFLFLTGTRDNFAPCTSLEEVAARFGERARVHRLEEADHSFGVRKRSPRSTRDVQDELADHLLHWLSEQVHRA